MGSDERALAALFRLQSGRLVAYLTRFLGLKRIDLAEDVAQEALVSALQAWRSGLPPDPAAWLFVTAKNRARDVLRRERVRAGQGAVDAAVVELEAVPDEDEDADLVRMMFACCHPDLTEDTQTALILRLVCGFGTAEVASAFLSEPAAMEKRLVRAKKVLADEGREFAATEAGEPRDRQAAVMNALYLMFDAGYHGTAAEPVRADLCADAIRLALLLAEGRATSAPSAHALVALMCLHAARLSARAPAGVLVPLEEQDRRAWDSRLVRMGLEHLSTSADGSELTAFHLEAGIAAHHATAPSVDKTRWSEIADLYGLLFARKPTPLVGLCRAIARSRVHGPELGLREVATLDGRQRLESYPFYWATLVDLAIRAGDRVGAKQWIARGLTTARNDAERAMFSRRLAECELAPS